MGAQFLDGFARDNDAIRRLRLVACASGVVVAAVYRGDRRRRPALRRGVAWQR
jgi:hypothetical protein